MHKDLPAVAVAMWGSIHVCLVEIGLFSSKDICLRAELANTGERSRSRPRRLQAKPVRSTALVLLSPSPAKEKDGR